MYPRSISAHNTELLQIIRVPAVRNITHDVINELELRKRDRPFRHLQKGGFNGFFFREIP